MQSAWLHEPRWPHGVPDWQQTPNKERSRSERLLGRLRYAGTNNMEPQDVCPYDKRMMTNGV